MATVGVPEHPTASDALGSHRTRADPRIPRRRPSEGLLGPSSEGPIVGDR